MLEIEYIVIINYKTKHLVYLKHEFIVFKFQKNHINVYNCIPDKLIKLNDKFN